MRSIVIYLLAAAAEIGGCFAFWLWAREGRTAWWLAGGLLCLVAFAWLLTRIEASAAGRAFAAYGGIYIVASLLWMALVEHKSPDRWDLLGGSVCLAGALIILLGPRPA